MPDTEHVKQVWPTILSAYDRPEPVGTPADRDTLRTSMPWSRALIESHYRAFGGLASVVAVENGYVYRWQRGT